MTDSDVLTNFLIKEITTMTGALRCAQDALNKGERIKEEDIEWARGIFARIRADVTNVKVQIDRIRAALDELFPILLEVEASVQLTGGAV